MPLIIHLKQQSLWVLDAQFISTPYPPTRFASGERDSSVPNGGGFQYINMYSIGKPPQTAQGGDMRNASTYMCIRATIQLSLGTTLSGMTTDAKSKGLEHSNVGKEAICDPPPPRPRTPAPLDCYRCPVADSGNGTYGSPSHVCFYQRVLLDDILD